MPRPIVILHRRNRIDQLTGLPPGCWIEIDVDIHEGTVWLTHDALANAPMDLNPAPARLADFLPAALAAGVQGFVIDCKRENVEKAVQPLVDAHGIQNYFYLNEMEVQADIFQSQNAAHPTGIRVWKYRGAADVIRLTQDRRAASQPAPQWVWVDCWQPGLLQNIDSAHIPLSGAEAGQLQTLGVKLCVCSPELYAHKYDAAYDAETLNDFYRGIAHYRQRLEQSGIHPDAVCSKFPHLWQDDSAL